MNVSNLMTLIFGIIFIIILYFIVIYALKIMNKDMANSGRRKGSGGAPRKKVAFGVEVIDAGENFDLKEGSVFPLRGDKITVGRRDMNAIILNDQYVSGNHAQFYTENNAVFVEDLNSTNGVFLNGYRIQGSVRVKIKDEVRIGSAIFRVI